MNYNKANYTPDRFWQEAYLVAMKNGNTPAMAKEIADQAKQHYMESYS